MKKTIMNKLLALLVVAIAAGTFIALPSPVKADGYYGNYYRQRPVNYGYNYGSSIPGYVGGAQAPFYGNNYSNYGYGYNPGYDQDYAPRYGYGNGPGYGYGYGGDYGWFNQNCPLYYDWYNQYCINNAWNQQYNQCCSMFLGGGAAGMVR